MPSFAQVTVMGHAGSAPEQRYTPKGTQVAQFSVAVNNGKRQADGSWSDETAWYRVVAYGQLAERVIERVTKGALVLALGRLRPDVWLGRDGQKNTTLEIMADQVQVLSRQEQSVEGEPAPPPDLENLPF